MATRIATIGNTVAVEIPEDLLRQANLAVGDPVDEPRHLPIVEYHPLADAGGVECAR